MEYVLVFVGSMLMVLLGERGDFQIVLSIPEDEPFHETGWEVLG